MTRSGGQPIKTLEMNNCYDSCNYTCINTFAGIHNVRNVIDDVHNNNVIGSTVKAIKSYLRVNITIVYEHTVCATSAFSMCMFHVSENVYFAVDYVA